MKKYVLTGQDTASLCDALGYLLEAGLNHGEALLMLARDERQPRLKVRLEAMASQADAGSPLHQVFEQAGCFPEYVCRLLAVGEQVGKTAQTLSQLAEYYRRRCAMEQRLRVALMYPAALLAVLLGVVCVLLVWVMPVFQEVYAGMGSSLTGLAAYLLAFGQGLSKALPWMGLGLALILAVLALPPVRRWLKERFGDRGVWRDIHSAQYLQALSLGIGCGMAEQESAALASRLAWGGFARRCAGLHTGLCQGESLSSALAQQGFLGAADQRLLEAANRAGHGHRALQTVAEGCTRRSEEALERKFGHIEPLMVALACGLVALVLISVMVPLVSIMNTLG